MSNSILQDEEEVEGPTVSDCMEREVPSLSKFPLSIVWTPIPCVSSFFPLIGHVGITDSQGRIWDFHGHNTVRVCIEKK